MIHLRIKQTSKFLIVCWFMISINLSIVFANDIGKSNKVQIQERFSVKKPTEPITLFSSPEETYYLLYLWDSSVFPGLDLICSFKIFNVSSDSIKLAPDGISFPEYLTLEYFNPTIEDLQREVSLQDTEKYNEGARLMFEYLIEKYSKNQVSSSPQEIEKIYLGRKGVNLLRNELPEWGKTNILAPNSTIEVTALCTWEELSNLEPGVKYFRWVFDNSNAAQQDMTIHSTTYKGAGFPVEIKNLPENRLDSLYYMHSKADRLNLEERFKDSFEICFKILQIDSSNLNALITISDVLWKMNRFDESIPYAKKGIDLIENHLNKFGVGVAYMDADYYLNIFRTRIDKCQRREKWKWAK